MKLNDEQRKIICDNHQLVYIILKDMSLDVSEWYDVAALALCESVFNGKSEPSDLREDIVQAIAYEQYLIQNDNDIFDTAIRVPMCKEFT